MFSHLNERPSDPERVVILGAAGFVGAATSKLLGACGIDVLAITRKDLNLLSEHAVVRLHELLRPTDSLVVISAKAPCKNTAMLLENIQMMTAICAALERISVAHVIYVSSDAVYRDSKELLNEQSCAEPGSLHGAMHLAREVMMKSIGGARLAVLRPTLIYGLSDPHNGYGPNRFRRVATAGQDIILFGEGEERRDHVLIDDVAELIYRTLCHRSSGTLNIATGDAHSFRTIAEWIAGMSGKQIQIRGSKRQGPLPHGGYRAFDSSATRTAFQDFRYTPLQEGLRKIQSAMVSS